MSQRILRKNNYLFSLDQKMYFSNFAGRCARAGDVGHPVGQIFELNSQRCIFSVILKIFNRVFDEPPCSNTDCANQGTSAA